MKPVRAVNTRLRLVPLALVNYLLTPNMIDFDLTSGGPNRTRKNSTSAVAIPTVIRTRIKLLSFELEDSYDNVIPVVAKSKAC